MKSQLLKLAKKPFVRNVATVASGTALAQAIVLLFSPIITRIYGPEPYGLLGAFMAVVGVLIPFAALRYPNAIVLPKHDQDARSLTSLSIIITLTVAGIVTLALCLSGERLLTLLGAESITSFKLLIPVYLILASLVEITQRWIVRNKQFKIKAKAAVAHSFVVNGLKVGVGFAYPLAIVLIILTSIGQAFHAMMLTGGILKKGKRLNLKPLLIEKKALKDAAKQYSDFPMYHLPRGFLSALAQSAPVLLLAAFFGPVPAGFYTLSKRVLKTPSSLISNSVATVFYPKIVEALHNNENIHLLIVKSTGILALLGLLPFLLVMLLGPGLFAFVFGQEWADAGLYASVISFWMYTEFIKAPSGQAIVALRQQRIMLIIGLITFVLKIVTFLIGAFLFDSAILGVGGFAIMGVFHNLAGFFVAYHKSRHL